MDLKGFPMAANLLRTSSSPAPPPPPPQTSTSTAATTTAPPITPLPFTLLDADSSSCTRFITAANSPSLVSLATATSPAHLASLSPSLIVTMLPASAHVRHVYLNQKDGIIHGVHPGTIVIDSSTIDPRTSKEVAEKLAEKGAIMVDAPVSGGTAGAQAGTLTFMVGAENEDVFNKIKPYLSRMGKNIVYCGPNGNGQVAKIVNNMLLGISMVAASEAMNLGTRLGMDPKLLAGILNTSSGRCWSTDTYNPCPGVMPGVPASRDYEGGFGVSLMAKDMGLAVTAASESKSTVALGSLAHQIYTQVSSTPGFEKKDFSAVFKWLNDNAKKY